MRRWFRSIGARIFAGFGLFIGALAVFFVLTARTTQHQSDLLEEAVRVDAAKADVAKLLQRVEAMRAYALLAARLPEPVHLHVDAHRSLDRLQEGFAPKLAQLREQTSGLDSLHARLFRHHIETDALLDELQGLVPPGTRKSAFDEDFERILRVDELLDNPFDPGHDIRAHLDSMQVGLQSLALHLDEAVRITDEAVEQSGRRLDTLVRWISLFVLLAGLAIAAGVTRGIRVPLRKVRARLLYLSRGIDHPFPMPARRDEIGEMAEALDRLADGLHRTREFSAAVGRGQFDTEYTPLSEEDVLGKTLLAMRDDLASYEREMEAKVAERTETLTRQTAQLEAQGEEIRKLYTDLTSSIDYARRIQGAILPSESLRKSVFDRQFVLYMPRDGVSGDFPWFHKLDAWRMFAAVDCTGHGVPGAFMSLLGHNALQHIGKVYTQPGKILDRLNEHARNVLHRGTQSEDQVPDGMDLGLMSINLEERKLEFAGANAPGYHVRNGQVTELKPDKRAIASFEPGEFRFTTQVIGLEEGDMVYCASDGYQDQFGGPKGRKFMRKQLRQLLGEISALPVGRQEEELRKRIEDWRGTAGEEQVDDILICGVRVRLG
ncbi:MAG: HAMP domain-containing protein [Crocinitomicaceae bacterium TMED114]|nr:MAG: HAMP domain-containing protein [Crocinitomicaceae bacterium TMED114]